MRMPLFSVIIPTLNEEKFVGNLLESLSRQTTRDFEVILVDASPNPRTVQVAHQFRQKLPSLTILTSQKPAVALQRNLGAERARGQWLVFVDADSILLPYFFERIKDFIATKKPSFFTTWFRPDSEITGDALITLLTDIGLEGSQLLHRPVAPGPLTLVQRAYHEAVGGYDEDYRFGEDADYGRRLVEHGFKFQLLRETLVSCSLRRFRREGTLRVLRTYALCALAVLLVKRTPRVIPGYLMGGLAYDKLTRERQSFFRKYEMAGRRFLKELFAFYADNR